MANKTAALRYARALLDVTLSETRREGGAAAPETVAILQRIEQELAQFVELVAQHPPLEKVLLNPAIPVSRKQAAVGELVARLTVSPVVAKLVGLLAGRDRLVLLPEILAAFRERLLDYQQIVQAEVTTAEALSDDRTEAITKGLTQLTGRPVRLATKVDPSIVGGIVARIGGTVYDASVTTQLKRMRRRLVESA